MQAQSKSTTSIYGLLASVILIWGLSWPIMKVALDSISPLWLATVRMGSSAICMFIFLKVTGKLVLPTRKDLPTILIVGIFQMAAFTACINLGMMNVDAGRSAILCYTTPLWIAPVAVLIFKESITPMKICGLILGALGITLLFNPLHFDWHNHPVVIGNIFLVLSAIFWGACTLHNRFSKWYLSPVQLAPWQLLISTTILGLLTLHYEPHSHTIWSINFIGLLVFLGPLATAFCYTSVITINREIPSITISLALLGVPILGMLSSKVFLHEQITTDMTIAMLLLVAGVACVILSKEKPVASQQDSDSPILEN